jgi:hypothetical protein
VCKPKPEIERFKKGAKHMSVHVKNGTPLQGESLCETCVHSHIQKGYRESERLVFCQLTYPSYRVPFRVRECSGYTEMKRQTLKQMEDIAWPLTGAGINRQVGFIPARDAEDRAARVELILSEEE